MRCLGCLFAFLLLLGMAPGVARGYECDLGEGQADQEDAQREEEGRKVQRGETGVIASPEGLVQAEERVVSDRASQRDRPVALVTRERNRGGQARTSPHWVPSGGSGVTGNEPGGTGSPVRDAAFR